MVFGLPTGQVHTGLRKGTAHFSPSYAIVQVAVESHIFSRHTHICFRARDDFLTHRMTIGISYLFCVC